MEDLEFAKMMAVGVLFIGLPVLALAGFLLWAVVSILAGSGPCPWLP